MLTSSSWSEADLLLLASYQLSKPSTLEADVVGLVLLVVFRKLPVDAYHAVADRQHNSRIAFWVIEQQDQGGE